MSQLETMRYKGVIPVAGSDRPVILQGVHMLMGIVFIGRQLPRKK